MGRADRERTRAAGRHLIRLAVVSGTTLGALLALAASPLAGLFSPAAAVASTATHALYICAAQQPVAALAFVLDGLVLGVGDYRGLSQSTMVALAVFAPCAALLLLHPSFGIVGLWLALTFWVACRAAMLLRRWRSAVTPTGTTTSAPERSWEVS
jgi:Na+-driven multidrug efflux pump